MAPKTPGNKVCVRRGDKQKGPALLVGESSRVPIEEHEMRSDGPLTLAVCPAEDFVSANCGG